MMKKSIIHRTGCNKLARPVGGIKSGTMTKKGRNHGINLFKLKNSFRDDGVEEKGNRICFQQLERKIAVASGISNKLSPNQSVELNT